MFKQKRPPKTATRLIVLVLAFGVACSDDPALGPSKAPPGPQCLGSLVEQSRWLDNNPERVFFYMEYRSPLPPTGFDDITAGARFYTSNRLTDKHEIVGVLGSHTYMTTQTSEQFPYGWWNVALRRVIDESDAGLLPGDKVFVRVAFNFAWPDSVCSVWENAYGACDFVDSVVVQ